MKSGGLFAIRTPGDLLKKALHDIARLRANPDDAYAVLDFFVAARQIPDWLHPNDSAKRDALFAEYVELRVCRHLGDQAKHFLATQVRHKQVQGTDRTHNAWGKSWGNSWGNAWGTDDLIVHLDPKDADTIKLGSSVRAIDLAEKVLVVLNEVVP